MTALDELRATLTKEATYLAQSISTADAQTLRWIAERMGVMEDRVRLLGLMVGDARLSGCTQSA